MRPGKRRAPARLLLTCEHASAAVPGWAQSLVNQYLPRKTRAEWAQALDDHRGSDPGALDVLRALRRLVNAPAVTGEATRLLVDLNRSARHPRRFSAFTKAWPEAARLALHTRLWCPHWQRVATHLLRNPRTVHVALHSFDPRLAAGRERIDVGVLYDPRRASERQLADALLAELRARCPVLRVRRNAPYLGIADGLPTAIRKRLPSARYAGLEIEVSQALVHSNAWPQLTRLFAQGFAEVLSSRCV